MATMIYGTIYDSGSTKLTVAVVTIPNIVVTSNQGNYTAMLNASGTYQVTASCANYQPQTIAVTVAVGQMKLQDFHLTHV
jgi:hypothetical protein